jgi:hypothetical protein
LIKKLKEKSMFPTTKRTQRVLLRALLLLALLMALAGIGQSQTASCLSSQLSAQHEADDGSAGGHRSIYFSLRNKSKSPCMLNGTPGVALLDPAGRRMKTKVDKWDDSSVESKAVTLAPDEKAFFEVRYSSCEFTNGALERKERCTHSAKLGFTPPGTKGMVIIREPLDANGWISGVSPIVARREELGIEAPASDDASATARCLSSQLSLLREANDAAMGGRRSLFYSFKNNSQSPCTLAGWPVYVLLDGKGHPLKVVSSGGEGEPNAPKPVTLAPAGKAFFAVNYTSCSPTTRNDSPWRCRFSAKARITAPGTKRVFIVREAIDPQGPYFDVTALTATLEELGISIEKPKP